MRTVSAKTMPTALWHDVHTLIFRRLYFHAQCMPHLSKRLFYETGLQHINTDKFSSQSATSNFHYVVHFAQDVRPPLHRIRRPFLYRHSRSSTSPGEPSPIHSTLYASTSPWFHKCNSFTRPSDNSHEYSRLCQYSAAAFGPNRILRSSNSDPSSPHRVFPSSLHDVTSPGVERIFSS